MIYSAWQLVILANSGLAIRLDSCVDRLLESNIAGRVVNSQDTFRSCSRTVSVNDREFGVAHDCYTIRAS